MLQELVKPPEELNTPVIGEKQQAWWDDMVKTCEEMTSDRRKDPSSHDHQNKLALDAKAGFTNGAHTAIATGKKQDDLAAKAKMLSCTRHFAAVTEMSSQNSLSFNLNLAGIKLDDPHMVSISKDGILMVRGEGPDSELREATLAEKVQIETESKQCSIAVTKEELEIQEYLNGGTVVPEHLKDLAAQKGFSIEHTTRQDYENLFNEEYANQLHIIAGSQGALPVELDSESLLPPRTGTSASESVISAENLLEKFSLSSSPALSVPSLGPVPIAKAPAPEALTPA